MILQASVVLPTKDFRSIETVSVKVSADGLTDGTTSVTFTVLIPKYIYAVVQDKHVSYSKEFMRSQQKPIITFDRNKKLRQTLVSEKLSDLLDELAQIGRDAQIITELERLSKTADGGEKFLAVKYSGSKTPQTSSWNHATLGEKQTIHFQWCIVFRVKRKDIFSNKETFGFHSGELYGASTGYSVGNQNYRFHDRFQSGDPNQFHDPAFRLIPWTQEREDFLKRLEDGFSNLRKTLNSFLNEMTEESLEQLMLQESKLKLLTQV